MCSLENVIGKNYFTSPVLFFDVFVYHLYTARSASNFEDVYNKILLLKIKVLVMIKDKKVPGDKK